MAALGLAVTLHPPVTLKVKLWWWGGFVFLTSVGLVIAVLQEHQQATIDQAQTESNNALKDEVKSANTKLDNLASSAGITVKGGLNDKLDYLINNLGATKEAVTNIAEKQDIEKEYHEVAMLGPDGQPEIENMTIPRHDALSETLAGAYTVSPSGMTFNIDSAAEDKFRKAIQLNPDFPFSYLGLGIILRNRGDKSWRDYFTKAESILEKTTTIPGHSSRQDFALHEVRGALSTTPLWSVPDTSASSPQPTSTTYP